MTQAFVPGIQLSRLFYEEAVRPILEARFPGLPYAAGLVGDGSEKLGFDTPMSTDHNWGPSVLIFLRDQDAHIAGEIREAMANSLPYIFRGYSVNSAESALEPGKGVTHPEFKTEGQVNHMVFPTTVRAFICDLLRFDIDQPIESADWLTFPSQRLLAITAGAVHHDGTGELTAVRERLAWYPHDVWLYMLASGWQRISQEEHLMPRAGFIGDELGSAVIGSRLVRDVMTHCFLMERRYAPYPKWFGTAFQQLACAPDLTPTLIKAQTAATWQEREAALVPAYEYMARAHNALSITAPLPTEARDFFGRPFKVIYGEHFADAITATITDPAVQRIASRRLIGSIDQFSDSTDLRSYPEWRETLRALYT
ncbi:MAG: DUF4037 domain-containing protein [Chloroflexota bacterium]